MNSTKKKDMRDEETHSSEQLLKCRSACLKHCLMLLPLEVVCFWPS